MYAEIRVLFEELYENYEKINDRTEDQLIALLTLEELEQLPKRKREYDAKKGASGKGASGKGASGKGASGKGAAGKGASGKGATGK